MDIKNKLQSDQLEINKLKSDRFEIDAKIKSIEQRFNGKIFHILLEMGSCEFDAINDYKNNNHNTPLGYLKPSWYFGSASKHLLSIKYKKNGANIKYCFVQHLDDGSYPHFYKTYIPYTYFDMSNGGITNVHFKWAENKIIKIMRQKKIESIKLLAKQKLDSEKIERDLYLSLKNKYEQETI